MAYLNNRLIILPEDNTPKTAKLVTIAVKAIHPTNTSL